MLIFSTACYKIFIHDSVLRLHDSMIIDVRVTIQNLINFIIINYSYTGSSTVTHLH